MKSQLKLNFNYNSSMLLLIFIILMEANYWILLPKIVTTSVRNVFWIIATILPLLFTRLSIKRSKVVLPWFFYLVCIIINNQEFANGGFQNTLRISLCILMMFVCLNSPDWIISAPKVIVGVGIANVFATLIFFVSDSLYQLYATRILGFYQKGTSGGQYGYRAALADHYSQNGTYIAFVFIVLCAALCCGTLKKKTKKYILVLVLLSAVALLLTAKRAHLLFGVATVVLTYYSVSLGNKSVRTLRLMLIAVAALLALSIAIEYVPQLAATFERFQSAGEDTASTKRFEMWSYALEMFKQNPLFGIGWSGFGYRMADTYLALESSSGAHNSYIQILCETGLVGFGFFIAAIGSSFVNTFKNIKTVSKNAELVKYKNALVASFAMQVFTLALAFTENAMRDRTFHFYAVAVAINLAFTVYIRQVKTKAVR